ncbi:hypothetical protein TH61_04380 [Rufibacter sp. DG15C]|uniref:hypothetical protein n=1 Tax=Rufibacter sp. DG15C TaxID=1379909 RepID=UPI00078BE5DC|nr:hypothetical protein [Rufibacter sp. DG15C]AMM50566.1 hypothetical protein TH61_04380 [Rufibacter sp. DG15C]
MKFIFKIFVLVGIIIIGKFLKEDTSNAVVTEKSPKAADVYSMKETAPQNVTTQQTSYMFNPSN